MGGRRAPAGEAWVLPQLFEHEPEAKVLRVWARSQEDEGDLWAPNPRACPLCRWGCSGFKQTWCVCRDSLAGCHLCLGAVAPGQETACAWWQWSGRVWGISCLVSWPRSQLCSHSSGPGGLELQVAGQ